MKNKIKIGWIGCGFIGQVAHLRSFAQNEKCNIFGLAEIREDILKKVSSKYSIKKTYLNYKDLINEQLDAIVLIVRRYHTYHLAREILEKNLPLFTEKPMAANYDQANKLYKISNSKKLTYVVGNMRLHDDGIKKAKLEFQRIIKNKVLGKLISFRIFCHAGDDYVGIDNYFKSDINAPNHYIHNNGPEFLSIKERKSFEKFLAFFCHDLNLLNFFLGKPKNIFSSKLSSSGGVITFDYKNFHGTFEFNYLNQSIWHEGISFYFDNGYMDIKLPPAFLKNQSATYLIYDNQKQEYKSNKITNTWSFKNQANFFIDLISKRKFNNDSAFDSLNDIKLAEEIWRKAF